MLFRSEAIAGFPVRESSLATDMARVTKVLGEPGSYTDKGRQLASVQINLSGGPRPFALEGLADRFSDRIRFRNYTAPELHKIARKMVSDRDYSTDAVANKEIGKAVAVIAAKPDHANGRSVSRFIDRVQRAHETNKRWKSNIGRIWYIFSFKTCSTQRS